MLNELSRPPGSAELSIVSTAMADKREADAVVDLLGGTGTGPLWGMASSDLNATLLVWPPRYELVEDTNIELDVLLIVVAVGVAQLRQALRVALAREDGLEDSHAGHPGDRTDDLGELAMHLF